MLGRVESINDMLYVGAALILELMDRVDTGRAGTTRGGRGFLSWEMVKAVLEVWSGCPESTETPGRRAGDPAGRGSPNPRNGSNPKTLPTEVGAAPLDTPPTAPAASSPGWCPRAPAAPAAWTR